MGNLRTTSSVLATLQAAAADISVSGHKLSITGVPTLDYRKIESMSTGFVASVAEVLQITTVTPTAANNTTFSLYLTQFVNGVWVTGYLTHTTDASGQTATDICNALRAQLLAQSTFKITGSGAATLILTAQAGYPIFLAQNISPSTTTVVTGTPGVKSRGTYADLVAAGVTGATAGATYSQIPITFVELEGSLMGNTESSQNKHTLYVQEGVANFAAFYKNYGSVQCIPFWWCCI